MTTSVLGPDADGHVRDKILDAAARCFARDGVVGTTVVDIAAEAGYSRPTIYKHAGSRETIALGLLEREWIRLREGLHEALSHYEDPVDKLVEAVTLSVIGVRSHPVFRRLLDSEPDILLAGLTTGATPVLRATLRVVGPLLEAGATSGHLPAGVHVGMLCEQAARLALSLIVTPSVTFNTDDPVELRRFVEHAFLGLRHPPSSATDGRTDECRMVDLRHFVPEAANEPSDH